MRSIAACCWLPALLNWFAAAAANLFAWGGPGESTITETPAISRAKTMDEFAWPPVSMLQPDFRVAPLRLVYSELCLPLTQCHHALVFGRLLQCGLKGTRRLLYAMQPSSHSADLGRVFERCRPFLSFPANCRLATRFGARTIVMWRAGERARRGTRVFSPLLQELFALVTCTLARRVLLSSICTQSTNIFACGRSSSFLHAEFHVGLYRLESVTCLNRCKCSASCWMPEW